MDTMKDLLSLHYLDNMWKGFRAQKPAYIPVHAKDQEICQPEDPHTGSYNSERRPGWSAKFFQLFPWITTLVFALSTLSLSIKHEQVTTTFSFSTGWATDFVGARSQIEVQEEVFNGSPAIDANKHIFIPNPDPIAYVGPPSKEIDDNWEELTWGRYILITKEEAESAWGHDIEEYWDHERGGYVAGLDMFHTLHCLGNLRKALHPEYYGSAEKDANYHLHQDHCIEQLRQYVMCSGDMTPIPTKYYPALGRNYVESDRPHTCRNFAKLQHWMVDRYEGPSAVKSAKGE
ncbi:uncharacterized protein N7479_005963 [Penicillium vulpinum]|nr:uncharacterized protein N7479_005963 [Penicillium vulpinum]KAJ5958813.1 hypothetical protein N7479_005963 [Penicillium vulpinum]